MKHVVDRMQLYGELSPVEIGELQEVTSRKIEHFRRGKCFAREGDQPLYASIVLSGWVAGVKDNADGSRQIIGFYLPGDTCDSSIYILHWMDHSLEALTDCSIGQICPADFRQLMRDYPRVAEAFWWNELVSASIRRQWISNLNGSTALQRMGHLICELHLRLASVGLAGTDELRLPLTQEMLANATGMTAVHANRTLQELRRRGLIETDRRDLILRDLEGLRVVSGFDPLYLHLQGCRSRAGSSVEPG